MAKVAIFWLMVVTPTGLLSANPAGATSGKTSITLTGID